MTFGPLGRVRRTSILLGGALVLALAAGVAEREALLGRPAQAACACSGMHRAHASVPAPSEPSEPSDAPSTLSVASPSPQEGDDTMALIPGGAFDMGAASGTAHEAPVHEVRVDAFYLDKTEVAVDAFERFVRATGYVTEAERVGSSGTFIHALGEWRDVAGASWRHPDGPSSNADPREPVAQVSWQDATAYARWAGKRLPTEAEWERAARGGLSRATYAWGNDLRPSGKLVANFWQGTFPAKDEGEDGFRGRAPVASFPANGFGLHDMTGNVWEWVADFYSESYYAGSPHDNPTGPAMGIDRVMRGGSFLCSANFCTNYRVAGRGHGDPHNPLNNVGFRCARSLSH